MKGRRFFAESVTLDLFPTRVTDMETELECFEQCYLIFSHRQKSLEGKQRFSIDVHSLSFSIFFFLLSPLLSSYLLSPFILFSFYLHFSNRLTNTGNKEKRWRPTETSAGGFDTHSSCLPLSQQKKEEESKGNTSSCLVSESLVFLVVLFSSSLFASRINSLGKKTLAKKTDAGGSRSSSSTAFHHFIFTSLFWNFILTSTPAWKWRRVLFSLSSLLHHPFLETHHQIPFQRFFQRVDTRDRKEEGDDDEEASQVLREIQTSF